MEKKWQAMLHEAADASFQKEIEVLAVMDSAAYSYVDLPQTALCTLSEIYVDVEDADIESLDKNGITGYFFEKDNLKYVCFDCDGCSFAVYGSLEEDELIKIAAGIAKE